MDFSSVLITNNVKIQYFVKIFSIFSLNGCYVNLGSWYKMLCTLDHRRKFLSPGIRNRYFERSNDPLDTSNGSTQSSNRIALNRKNYQLYICPAEKKIVEKNAFFILLTSSTLNYLVQDDLKLIKRKEIPLTYLYFYLLGGKFKIKNPKILL